MGCCQPSWAIIDGVVSGAKAVKDEAHQRIVENQLIQLAITAKKNYDASIKIYKEARRLNEGKGIIHNVTSDLSKKAKEMAKEEQGALKGEFDYRNDSGLDHYLTELDEKMRVGVESRGKGSLGFMDGVNSESAQYAESLKKQLHLLAMRAKRQEAARQEGAKIASSAKTATDQALGLTLQTAADQAEVMNQQLALISAQAAKTKTKELNQKKVEEEMVQFLLQERGAKRDLIRILENTGPARIPAIYAPMRKTMSGLVVTLLGVLIAGGICWEFAKTKNINISNVIGLPLVVVLMGLFLYDKFFVGFAVVLNTLEETFGPARVIVSTFLSGSLEYPWSNGWVGKLADIAKLLVGGGFSSYPGWPLAVLSFIVLYAFLIVRFAFLALLYVAGPLFIACYLVPPLRSWSAGWLMSTVEMGLNGLGMRILLGILASSNVQNVFFGATGQVANLLHAIAANVVFCLLAIVMPFLIHAIVNRGLASVSLFGASAGTFFTAKSLGETILKR